MLGAEARGFWLGSAIALEAGVGFIPARRPGKLPPETVSASYVLEYGENSLELHPDLIPSGSKVVIHDDVLATGGTVEAISKLVEQLGGEVVGACFIIELSFLGGRERLAGTDLHALITLLTVLSVGFRAENSLPSRQGSCVRASVPIAET